jgi:tRNA pseudouridine38-40 synthase
MRKVLLTISFDGTCYHGWQAQRSGRGVVNALQQACLAASGETPEIVSSSRTDAGVHARALCAHLIVPASLHHLSAARLRTAINAQLPIDIRITDVAEVAPHFDARFDALRKEYQYQLWNHPVMNPMLRQQAWHVPYVLDEAAMRQTASLFVGRHDFRAFTSRRSGVLGDSMREVMRCEIERTDELWKIQIQASGFLYKMCRCMVGTLVQVARHRMSQEQVTSLLQGGNRTASGMNAPAHGLILWRVDY